MRHAASKGWHDAAHDQNLRDVEDSAPKFGMDTVMQARFAAGDLGMDRAVSLQRLLSGATQPFGHHHRGQESST